MYEVRKVRNLRADPSISGGDQKIVKTRGSGVQLIPSTISRFRRRVSSVRRAKHGMSHLFQFSYLLPTLISLCHYLNFRKNFKENDIQKVTDCVQFPEPTGVSFYGRMQF